MANIARVAKTGDQRKTLEALRDHLAEAIDDGVGARELPALAARLADVVATLAALPDAKERSAASDIADELAKRRAARDSKPKGAQVKAARR